MGIEVFNKEIRNLIKQSQDPTIAFVQQKFVQSGFDSYYGFFGNFLLNYGLVSFSCSMREKKPEYKPYFNFRDSNVFGYDGGIYYLTDQFHNFNKCHYLHAHQIVSLLRTVNISELENWKNHLV
ncbi:hypothetical protein PK35_15135 [Tamlana nanhaiensis]|uniref:Uncharacterized protein n=1 Tax=Neotamlana nanhaiensis TaxID=1382798 RepID=A0A0D7VYB7_9FLAO|nr:hypothetical protein [Tamlana nanhaiensis]KJD31438.1 hypothetical protein PK35_15135 [Tamlana nanhaiensis]